MKIKMAMMQATTIFSAELSIIEMQNGNAPKATRALNEEYPEYLKVKSQMVAARSAA